MIDVGADVKIIDKMGQNILHYVLNRNYNFDAFKMMLLAGAPLKSNYDLEVYKKKDLRFLKILI